MSSSEIFWRSNYYAGAVQGFGYMSGEIEGQINLTLYYSDRSAYKPGTRVELKMNCQRDDRMCYTQGRVGSQIMKLAIPMTGSLTGTYISANPIDHGNMEFKTADVEKLKNQVPMSSERLIEPPEFKEILSLNSPYGSMCVLL